MTGNDLKIVQRILNLNNDELAKKLGVSTSLIEKNRTAGRLSIRMKVTLELLIGSENIADVFVKIRNREQTK